MKKSVILTTVAATMLATLMSVTLLGQTGIQPAASTRINPVPVSSYVPVATGRPGLGRILALKAQEAKINANLAIPTASDVLANILTEAKSKKVPLAIYPPGYLDRLKAIGNRPMYSVKEFDSSAYSLKPGNKANMSWLDATAVMGSPASEAERNSDEVQHTSIISYGFYMGNYEITQSEYQQMVGNNPSWFTPANGYTADLNRPVENVTWAQANNYCALLTAQALANGSIPSGWVYRLPTEAEWEYSCRTTGGTQPDQVLYQQTDTSFEYDYYGAALMGPSFGALFVPSDDATVTSIKLRMRAHSTAGTITTRLYWALNATPLIEEDVPANSPLFSPAQGSFADVTIPVQSSSYANHFYGGVGIKMRFGPLDSHEMDLVGTAIGGYFYPYMTIMGNKGANPLTAFNFGNSIHGGMANFDDHYEYSALSGTINVSSPTIPALNMTIDVGSYNENSFGLYDMHGNVSEWCGDYYGAYPTATLVDYTGPSSGTTRVVRGGSWADMGTSCRSAIRSGVNPSTASSHIGFRIVLAPTTPDWMTAVQTQPSIKTYGIPPTKSKDNLVLITHGWTGLDHDISFVDTMSNNIVTYLNDHSVTDWQVYGYKWTGNSQTLLPDTALNNATQEGISLGNSIVNQGWAKVHFIAHSAGAQLIETATQIIKAYSPTTVVQCTFLDPYVGANLAGQSTYGLNADWSDRYASHGDVVNNIGYTDLPLDASYNVDVTALDTSIGNSGFFTGLVGQLVCSIFQSSHGWPITFYEKSIVSNPSDYDNFGFQQSAEAGTLSSAMSAYPVGNIASVRILGTAPASCAGSFTTYTATPVTHIDFTASPKASQSTSGTVTPSFGTLTLITGSPAWLSIVPTNTSPANLLSFYADFESGTGAAGLLTVCMDANVIGTVDERAVGEGAAQYTLSFPVTASNSTHVLSFRLDPFTTVQSTVILTNVVLSQVGVSQPFSLSITTNMINGLPLWQLTGQAGFDYGLQASTNLVDWTQIAVLENTSGAVTFYDPASTNFTSRFYRAVAPH